jgi:hypothetical protein
MSLLVVWCALALIAVIGFACALVSLIKLIGSITRDRGV